MSGSRDWPQGWSRGDGSDGAPGAPSGSDSERTQVMRVPPGRNRRDDQVQPPRRGAHPPPPFERTRPRRGGGGRRWARRAVIALLVIIALVVGMSLYFFSRIDKVDAVSDYDGRPEAASGTNWLIVGSDSREGLTRKQVKALHVGRAAGRRTDTIILLHEPASGPPTLVSLPRDSYVPIPGKGRNKINAAYAFGGAPLLAQTIEAVSGLRIDHYVEIGFGGFVNMTEAVGGVTLCPTRNIRDQKSGLRVKKGCQEMDGITSLAYVRARYFDPKGDLGRVERQQEYLGALSDKAQSPMTLLNPFRMVGLGNAATTSLRIDDGDGPVSLVKFALTMRAVAGGKGKRVTVPVADPNYSTPAGSAVRWDRDRALKLFRGLKEN